MSVYCQRCKNETATVHDTVIDPEGVARQLHLCEACAQQDSLPQVKAPTVLAIFKELLENPAATTARARDRQCPQCGMTFGEFKTKGRFGCAHDYEVFLSRVIPLLERVHGASEHIGESDAQKSRDDAHDMAARELKRLRRDLTRVIKDEKYEEAAALRDRIQKLEQQLDPDGPRDG